MTAPEKTAPVRSGVEPQPGPFIAHGASRDLKFQSSDASPKGKQLAMASGLRPPGASDSIHTSPDIREFAALVFVGLFFAVVLVALLLLRLIPFGELFR